MKIIGEKLKELRKEKDLTQTKLAEMFYLDKSTVAKLVRLDQVMKF